MTEQEIAECSKIEGSVRGTGFQTDARYVTAKQGKEGLRMIEETMDKYGYPTDYGRINALDWLPMRLRVISFLVMRDIFGWVEENFKEMGDNAPKHSFIMKLFSRFMTLTRRTFDSSPEFWRKYHSQGKFIPEELDEQKNFALIRIEDFASHPLYCKFLEGYFGRIFKYLYPRAEIKTEETRCTHKGDAFHEYRISW